MLRRIIWHWQLNHLTPKWINCLTGEVSSTIGMLLIKNRTDNWVKIKKWEAENGSNS